MTCSAARFLLVAGFVGVAASSLTGSDLIGLLAGITAALLLLAFERLGPGRARSGSCPVRMAQDPAPEDERLRS